MTARGAMFSWIAATTLPSVTPVSRSRTGASTKAIGPAWFVANASRSPPAPLNRSTSAPEESLSEIQA